VRCRSGNAGESGRSQSICCMFEVVLLTVVLRIVALLAFAGLTLLTVSWCRGQPKTRAPQDRGDRAPLVANFTAFGLLFLSLLIFSNSPAGFMALLLALSGSLLALAGASLVVISHAELGAAWSFAPIADQSTGIVTNGPYRLVRHPIYLGLAVLAVGEALAFGSWPALFIALSGIVPTLAWRARAEEKLLSRTFGESYKVYRQRTKMIVPYLL
jgi:protein-S-isoprenylcysteine O-methyltransferase Ste14